MSTTSTVVGTIMHCAMVWLLYFIADLGFVGICLATSIHFLTRFIMNVSLVLYTGRFERFSDVKLISK
jgi:Na+-driven multidrug efflux pump